MKALLICPDDRLTVPHLTEQMPLAVAPLLGRSLVEYWLEHLAARGATHVLVLAPDRPDRVRTVVGTGARWGLQVELRPESCELTPAEARAKYRDPAGTGDWLAAPDDIVQMDHLPGLGEFPLDRSYAAWFAALRAWMPRTSTPSRIGLREIQPGIWLGLGSRVAPTARLRAPCWLGENVQVGPDARIGPGAILEDRVCVEAGARIVNSVIGAETFVGGLTLVAHSLVSGDTLINWRNGSCLRVRDAFLLCPLNRPSQTIATAGWAARALAVLALTATAPLALAAAAKSIFQGTSLLRVRQAVRPRADRRAPPGETFAYHELEGAHGWLRRWPQFWSIARGDFTWVGNRPLDPEAVAALASDFERLWLAAPVGLISLADADGRPDGWSAENCGCASYYAVRSNRRLDWAIFQHALLRIAPGLLSLPAAAGPRAETDFSTASAAIPRATGLDPQS